MKILSILQDPQFEFLSYETIQTYKGHRPDRTVVIKEQFDMPESEVQKSPSAQRFLRSNTTSREISPRLSRCVSSNNLKPKLEREASESNINRGSPAFRKGRSASTSQPRQKRTEFTEFEQACLKAHNEYRLNHGVAPLKLNKKLCHFAEEWAKVRIYATIYIL